MTGVAPQPSERSGWPPGLIVLVAAGVLLAVAGLAVFLRAPSTASAAPAPPPVAPAPVPEQTGSAYEPELPVGPSGALGPAETIWLVLDANPQTSGAFTRAQVTQMARWACRRIAAWDRPFDDERLELWDRMAERYDLPDPTVAAIFTGVLEPVCSDGRGDAV